MEAKERKKHEDPERLFSDILRITLGNTKRKENGMFEFRCPFCHNAALSRDEWCYLYGIEHLFYHHRDLILSEGGN